MGSEGFTVDRTFADAAPNALSSLQKQGPHGEGFALVRRRLLQLMLGSQRSLG